MTTENRRMPVYFLSHGGGPWPWLDGPIRDGMRQLEESLQRLPGELPEQPKAILMVSGHWAAPGFTVQTSPNPPMLYDYGGFPEHTYRIQYPAPGSPALAARVSELLSGAGIPVAEDAERGFDHGMYSVLFPAWPDAEVPVVQLAIKQSFDPEEHLAVGQALAPLRDEGVLILGSGSATTTCASSAPPRRSRRPGSTSGSARPSSPAPPPNGPPACASGTRPRAPASPSRGRTTSSR
jgi:aromatic ring-opening dioxygenase catalytic subunit (LigB family)